MTPETNWAPAVIVLLVALGAGVVLLLSSRRGAALPAPTVTRRDELVRQKEQLYGLLRDHIALRGTVGESEWTAERDRIELEAARVLREIDLLAADAQAPQTAASPSFSQRNPRLVGALWGASVMLFVGAVGLALQEFAKPRAEGQSMTGGSAAGMSGGGAGPAAPQLSPAQQAQLAQLRAAVEASPQDADARNRLGHALLHAGQLMDAFNEAEATVQIRPEDPEARTHQAIVLIAIGDLQTAAKALDKVIVNAPTLAEALAYRGALHLQAGERDQAITLLERATAADPNLIESVQPLIEAARTGVMPGAAGGATASAPPSGSGPAAGGGGPMSGGAPPAGPSPDDITGTLAVDPGVAALARPGDTIFLSARPPGVDRGPPTWVARLKVDTLPMAFTLGPANAMLGGPTPPELVLTARIDRDGNPTTRSPDDLEGRTETLVPGAKGVTITLAAPK